MIVDLPDNEIRSLKLTNERARLEVAVGLYAGRAISLGRGARIAGISYTTFLQELGKHGISVNYTREDALQDIETVRQRVGK